MAEDEQKSSTVPSSIADEVQCAPGDSERSEDLALATLKQPDLAPDNIEKISKHIVAYSRKVRLAIVAHPKTPRHVALPIVRKLFTFDLMNVALIPTVAPDLKRAAEEVLVRRLESLSLGEKVSLARRASGAVAGVLLLETEENVITAALENPRLTEAHVTRALAEVTASAYLVETLCRHEEWSRREDVQIALLQTDKLSHARAQVIARSLPSALVAEVLAASRLPEHIKEALRHELTERHGHQSTAGL
jgi:hypothetical protein